MPDVLPEGHPASESRHDWNAVFAQLLESIPFRNPSRARTSLRDIARLGVPLDLFASIAGQLARSLAVVTEPPHADRGQQAFLGRKVTDDIHAGCEMKGVEQHGGVAAAAHDHNVVGVSQRAARRKKRALPAAAG